MTDLRILQVMGSSAGGVVRHVAEISSILAEAGGRVVVAAPASAMPTLNAGINPSFRQLIKHRVVEISDRPRFGDIAVVDQIRRLGSHADVVHAHGLRAGALAVLALTVFRDRPLPRIVITLHNLPVGSRAIRAVSRVLETIVGGGADVVLGVSGDLVELAETRGAEFSERALVPAPGRPITAGSRDKIRANLGVPSGSSLIVTVARLAPQKGLHYLCDAAAALNYQGLKVCWAIAGDGPLERELADRIAAESLPIALLGRRDDAPELMAAADIVANTSVWEGQPLVLQEALALGAPIVATNVGGTSEVTEDAAALVDIDDGPERFAQAIAEIIADGDLRAKLSQQARERAAQLPTRQDVLEQLTRVYAADLAQR